MPQASQEIDIPYQKFVLPNGLTLIVHEDHKAPIVAVNVWYHVGSKNEKPGKSGFAHLFEHLMFNGSENFNDDYFKAMERIGATDLNGTTNEDRTNYFQNVPTSALDIALWMESDRMGHLLGAIDQAKLDEQRGVVQNEKRQYENEPYGVTEELITKSTWPAGHPYSWTVIGSMEDLNAASLDDVKDWFKTYYGPANAVLVVAGDIDAATAKAKVEKYFGDIPSGPPIAKHDVWIARRTGTQRQQVQDRVPQARIFKVWNVPQWGSAENDYLTLVARVLSDGKTSRLYKRLVYDDQTATNVSAYIDSREIAGQFYIDAMAKPGQDLAKIEKAIDEELAKFLAEGPTEVELQRVKTQYEARFVRGIERIGGFGGKSDILAMNQVYGGSPDYYKTTLQRVREATAQNLLTAAKQWLTDGVYILEVHPFPEYKTAKSEVDRSKLPTAGAAPEVKFPTLQRATLSNGLKIILAERPSIPVVNFNLLVDAGYAADQLAVPGTASLAMDMLDEGTKTRTSLQINEQLALLGANLGTGSNLDVSSVSLSALKSNLDASLDIYADVILNPSFPEADFARLQKLQIARIQQEQASPFSMALRVLPKLIYGKDHAYGNPFTGSGTAESVAKLTRADLIKFHQTWLKPNNATLIIVGATTMAEIKPKLEKLFSAWKQGEVPRKNIGTVAMPAKSVVYLMDRPGSLQSVIIAGHVAPPSNNPDEIAITTMNRILGGEFTSRVNMNLREDKHWSYGARTIIQGARGQRPFLGYAPVQSDKTKESLSEMLKELRDIVGSRPITNEEFVKVQSNQTLQLPGRWETMAAVGGAISQIVQYGLPDNYFQTYAEKVRALKLADVSAAAKKVVHPDNLVWVVVGDRSKIEAGVRELGLGEIRFIDTEGNLVQ
ncbi:MAG: insulinase family protein [candidate division KSB1 bacterium]|nr:insulinase family protein [candidate division KSB1 bacterium]MDZ7303331.1 insulinase family protein [candidate division KSB1 bacterium]MDZ7310419.1 insulinase family protein [candidate division KSB1 bacterium]